MTIVSMKSEQSRRTEAMNLLDFMEKRLSRYELAGDKARANKLRKIIREWKAMDREQQTLSSL